HPDEFSATPFLTMAKGPAAPLFYAMVHDIDGRERLAQRPGVSAERLTAGWEKLCGDARIRCNRSIEKQIRDRDKVDQRQPLSVAQSDELRAQVDQFARPIETALWDAENRLRALLDENAAAMTDLLRKNNIDVDAPVPDEIRQWLESLGMIEKDYLDALEKIAAESKSNEAFLNLPKPSKPMVGELDHDAKLGKVVRNKQLCNAQGKPLVALSTRAGDLYLDAWDGQRAAAVEKYGLTPEQAHEARRVFRQYAASLDEYFREHGDGMTAYFGSLDRFEQARRAGGDGAAYRKQRDWDQQQTLRAEANGWLADLDAMGEEYRSALWGVLADEQKAAGPIPVALTREDLMDFAVTWSLTAIGLCMIVGFCNRLACLGGAAFLVSVLLTQPPWPTIYPPAPEVVGHALIVDKNFVEMVAMLALASLPVGRWAGLDAFLHRWIGQPLMKRFGCKNEE
ncbi:MAG: hypothetical protein JW719_14170, partial [Pirellulales bacterium]|nr:hypothetical protein [Pirellulales bacterium]